MEDAAARARHEATKAKLEAQFPIPKWYDISLPHVAPPSERPPALPMATSHLHANHRQHTANDALRSPARLHRRKIQTAAASPPKKPRLAPPLLQQTEAFGLWSVETPAPAPPDVLLSSYDMEAMLRAPPVVDDRWAPLVEPQPKPSRKRSSVTRQALAKSGSSFLGNHGSILERHRSSHVWSHVSRSIDEIYQDTAALVASPHSSSPDPHDTIALDEAEGDVDDSLSDDKMVATPHEAEPSNNLTDDDDANEADDVAPLRVFIADAKDPGTELDSDRRIGTPGLRRRESIRKLVHFADGHLRKKIFRGWSTIEFAFSGGDLTQVQVEKVLTSHNICVTRLDLERVHATIDAVFAKSFRTNRSTISVDMPEEATPHLDVPDEPRGAAVEELNNNDCDTPIATDASMTTDASIATDTSITTDAVHVHVKDANSISSGVPHTVSYELMMDLFYPHDEAEAAQWLFEMELERQAQLQEEDMRKQKLLELETKIKRRLAESAQDMWRVIKMFDYMHTSWPSQAVAEATTQRFHDLLFETTKRKKHTLQWDAATESAAVVPHASPDEPSNDDSETMTLSSSSLVTKHSIGHVFKALLQCFARNKCLEDLELDQAAHVFHDIAATVLQKGAVRFLERRAIFDCPERQAFLAYKLTKRVFRTWRANVLECIGRRRLLLRKFVAWKYLMTCSKWYRELFRLCFWPLHVWKRWTQFVIISRAKAIFLKNVFHEYYLLRHTRAWHRFALKKRALYAELATRKQRRNLATLRSIVDVWRPWAAYGQRVRKIWRKSGLTLHVHTKFYTTKLALYLWRYFTMLHRDMRRRQYVCLHGMLQRHRRKETLTDGVENDVVPLTRIMDSPMGHKIKHKTRLHDLCITTYIKYRKKDRLNTLAKALVFQRIGPTVFRILWLYKEKKKRSRLVSMFGVFNVVRHRFLCWLRFAMIKKQHERQHGRPTAIALVLHDEPSSRTVGRALQWRQDKEWRDQGLQEAACEAMALRDAIEALRVAREASHARFLRREDEIRDIKLAEQGIQDDEQGKTLQMTSQLHHYANQIIHTRVRKLYEVICRAFDIFEDQAREHLLKSTFRALRLPAMSKKMTLLCHRCQLRNWIRLAKRFGYWLHNMPRYHRLKGLHYMWQRWAKFIQGRQLFESPGLAATMRRRRVLVSKFEQHLLQEDFMMLPTVLDQKLAFNSFRAVFMRWVEWTQLHIGFTSLLSNFRKRMDARRLGHVFLSWKHHLRQTYVVLRASWREARYAADVERLRSSLWALRKHLVSWRVRKVLRACDHILKVSVCSNPTLKNLFAAHTKEVLRRLALENRLMFVAYNERKLHHYEERTTLMYGGTKGIKFEYDSAISFGHIRQVIVVCGKSIDGLSTVVKSFSETVEGRLYGNPFGTRSVFQLAPHELLVKVEGFASQSTLLGLRLGTSYDRCSKWYGRADIGVYFCLEAAPDEEVIGFHGYAAKDSVHGIGAVFRRTTERNIFEGLWAHAKVSADDASISQCDRQFSHFLQMRSCDIYAAMERAHRLALRMWRSESTDQAVNRLRIVMGICHWFFNALTHGLVKLSENEDEGHRILQEGINIRATGERLVAEGEKILESVSRYREGRKQQLNVAVLGFKKIQELRQNIELGEATIKRGKLQIADGNSVILAGRQLLPKIPLTDRMVKNVRELYRIVLTKDSMDSMSDGIRKLLLQDKDPDTSYIDMKDVAEARANAAFDMGQARAEVVSTNLRERLKVSP